MGKGSSSAPTSQTITQSNIPKEFMPYFSRLMGRVEEQSLQDYEGYGGPRLAPSENFADIGASRDAVRDLAAAGTPGIAEAQGMTRDVAQGAAGLAALQKPYQFSGYGGFKAGEATPYAGFSAVKPTEYTDFKAGSAQPFSDFGEAGFNEFQFGPSGQFTGDAVSQYMDPYMQNVVGAQKERAQEDYDIARQGRSARAVSAGAFGGSRAAVQEGLAERDLLQRQGEIQAQGLSSAYGDAQRMFEADRAARMTTEQAQAGEGARVQTGIAGEGARVQAARAAELARTQGIGIDEAARVQASEAAERARVQGMTQQEAARVQGGQAAELGRTQGINIGEQARVQGAQAGELARVQGAQAAENLAANQFGLDALRLQGQQAGQLAGLSEQERAAQIQNAQLLEGIGQAQRGEAQAGLDIGYQDYLRQQGYPAEQLGFYSDVLRGLPVADAGTTTQQGYQSYNPLQQGLGAGLSALSLYKAYA
jgi:hypothetical protein